MSNNPVVHKWEKRKEQIQILERFKTVTTQKKKFFVCESPTGTGKSYMVMLLCDYYLKNVNPEAKFDILTNLKTLQDQYLRDFDYIRSFKGKENYYCSEHSCSCSEGQPLNQVRGIGCKWCPYAEAKKAYKDSTIGLLNFHLYVSFLTYAEDLLTEREANVLFIDEAHSFEEVYCDFVNSYLSIDYLESIGITITDAVNKAFRDIRTKEDFANFLSIHVQPKLYEQLEAINEYIKDTSHSKDQKISKLKDYRKISRTKCKFGRFLSDSNNWKTNWTLETGKNQDGLFHKVEAIWGRKYLQEVWEKYDMVVFLSGTILDKILFSSIMGVDLNQASFLTIKSPFKPENRLIHFLDKGKMSYNVLEETYKHIVPEVKRILEKHKGEKGIIHTGNYKLAEWLQRDIEDERLLFHDNTNKDVILNQHIKTQKHTVLVSPSMVNGVDLKDDLARFQIVLKIPFPALDNERIKIRMKQNGKWYSWKTMCDLIQALGRSVRSEQDYATSYILDSNFKVLTNQIKLPEYIQEALVVE